MTHIFSMYRYTRYVYKSTRKAERNFKKSGGKNPKEGEGGVGRLAPNITPTIKAYASERRWMSEQRADDISYWCVENGFLAVDPDKTYRMTAKGRDFISWFIILPIGIVQVIFTKFSFLAGSSFTALVILVWRIIKS